MKIRIIITILSISLLCFSQTALGQSVKEKRKARKIERKAKRMERRANTQKYRSPFIVYPVYWAMQDTRSTPGIYRVLGAGGSFRLKSERPKTTLEHQLQANFGLGDGNFEDAALQYNTQFSFESNFLWKYKEKLHLGIQASAHQHSRIISALGNSGFASDAAISLGPVLKSSFNLQLFKKDTKVAATLGVPLISYVNRVPEFGLSFTGNKSLIAPIGRFNKISFRIDAVRLFKKSSVNRINYFYRWEYYGMQEFDGIHKLRIASHQVGFHLWIKRN